MKTLLSVLMALFLISCSSVRVTHDYDREVNFNQYKTYNYYADMNTGLSELDTKRFLDALDAQLSQQGYTLSKEPDFFIDVSSKEYEAPSRSSFGIGMGGTGRNVGGGISIGVPVGQSNINRQITVEFVDENKKQLFWQAVSETTFKANETPESRETLLKAMAIKILSEFPPKP
ncbi:DUF4136 domain-containing protein [Aestuariibaculum suncheonense]|uniref:DUF4136 domain-containing protein n=1 Tax=Aestuariibaculum suncheonense TaxID=1028745 RepID=A0A8J6Q582_9FLAO|nr:DUF4136 domain-containing protein [Aestuariibaculum suncheonense]MBD0834296.1 DUF4136 domain-containing protein [Aestuariibaculum suncheonense]